MAEKIINDNKKCFLKKVKSKYILKQIFNNVNEIITLDIIRYNKSFKKNLNKKINDYKKHYSKIEIEIIPEENETGKFIHIHNENLKPYFHIYFNDSKVEVKRNYLNKDDDVKKIKVILDYRMKSLYGIFLTCRYVKKIKFIKFNRSDIKMFGYMFYECNSLEEIDISNFNTNNANNMRFMFYGCCKLKALNFSNFNTNKVIYMNNMFNGCSSLKELNLLNFNTNNVKDMSNMFYGCSSLKELNLSNFITNNVENMESMFYYCSSLKILNVSNFNTSNVIKMRPMFCFCSSLEELDLSNFNTKNVFDGSYMFFRCLSLKKLNILNFSFNMNDFQRMFDECNSLKNLICSNSAIEKLYINTFNGSNNNFSN